MLFCLIIIGFINLYYQQYICVYNKWGTKKKREIKNMLNENYEESQKYVKRELLKKNYQENRHHF